MFWVKVAYLDHYPKNAPAIHHYSDQGNVCFDLYAADEAVIICNTITMIPLGIKMEPPEGYGIQIYPRSGLGSRGITMANNVGIIDNSYRGEIKVPMIALRKGSNCIIKPGDRIVQAMLIPIRSTVFHTVSESDLSETERGMNGFGSTGK